MAFPATALPARVFIAPGQLPSDVPQVTATSAVAYKTANTATITTAAFTPASNTLLVALVSMGNGTGSASSLGVVSDSLAGSWTRLGGVASPTGGVAEIWARDIGTGASMTVTYDPGGAGASGLDIQVLTCTNAKPVAAQLGATATMSGVGAYAGTITTTTAGALVLGALGRASDAQVLTANAITTILGQFNGSAGDTAAVFRATANVTTPGATTIGATNAPTGANWISLVEIQPIAADSSALNWTEITSDVRVASDIVLTAGATDEGALVDASTCKLTINNRGGHYSPRNALGQWYGRLNRNTPIQVRLDAVSDTFTRTVAAGGWGTSDSGYAWVIGSSASSWSVNGSVGQVAYAAANTASFGTLSGIGSHDVDMVYSVACSVVTSGGPWISAAVLRYADANNHYRVHTELKPAGVITIKISRVQAGVLTDLIENLTTGVTYTAGAKVYTRVQADGPTIRCKVWTGSLGAEPSTWGLSYSDSVYLTGAGYGFYQWRYTTESTAGTVTVSVDDLAISAVLFSGAVNEWPPRWNITGSDSWAPITASGTLRRLAQTGTTLRSPLYRQLIKQSPTGYWPLEDDSSATSAASALANGYAATATDVTFSSEATLKGSDTCAKLNSTASAIRGRTSRRLPSSSTGFAHMWIQKMGGAPGSAHNIMDIYTTGTVAHWTVVADASGFSLKGYDSDSTTVIVSTGVTLYTVDPTQWTAIQLETQVSAGTVTYTLLWANADAGVFYFLNGTYSGTPGSVTQWVCKGTANLAVAHVWSGDNSLPFVTASFANAVKGYNGETAASRFARLCSEEGLPGGVEPATTSSPLGPQKVGALLTLLRDVEAADQGILYEGGRGLVYRPRAPRHHRTVDLALDFNSQHVGAPPEPTDDDLKIRNDWTVSRLNGSSARAISDASVAAVGQYDSTVTVNLYTDDVLADHASWRVHLGTVDLARWPRVTLNLARIPALIPTWLACMVGSRVTVANPPSQMSGVELDLIVEGWTQTLHPYGWVIDLSCSPAQPWNVGRYDTAANKYDTSGSTLAVACSSSATSLSVAVADANDLWTTTGTPFDINLDGERCTVTAVSGASSPQTFTVTRSVNGVSKAHAIGATVSLWTPVYYGI